MAIHIFENNNIYKITYPSNYFNSAERLGDWECFP